VYPKADRAFAIFAQAMDRSGFAAGMLAPRAGMVAKLPPMDPRPLRTMADMGMMAHEGMEHDPTPLSITVDNVAAMPMERLGEPGTGLDDNGRRVLTYAQLRARKPGTDPRPPAREITLHLTGNMGRYIWGFDGQTFMQAKPIPLRLGERVRFAIINDTMMEHPIHLHGLWSELENDQGAFCPYKHTILAKPGERLTFLVTADVPGRWAFHCHLLYHMESGMFREVVVA
jgi:FtsP/CotA-like multicopper oxidase with cupredoxin domain